MSRGSPCSCRPFAGGSHRGRSGCSHPPAPSRPRHSAIRPRRRAPRRRPTRSRARSTTFPEGPDMTDTPDDARLTELEPRFFAALSRKEAGDLDAAEEELRAILRVEPRLPEPHLELGRLLLDTDR